MKRPGKGAVVDAGVDAQGIERIHIGFNQEIGRIDQAQAVNLAAVLARILARQHGEGIVQMRRRTAEGLYRLRGVHNRRALDIELTRPCAVQMDQVKVLIRELQGGTHRAGELHRLLALVADHRPSGDRAGEVEHGVIKIHAEILYLVAQGDLQGLRAVAVVEIGVRQVGIIRLSLDHLIGIEQQIRHIVAFLIRRGDRRGAKVRRARAGIFHGHHVRGEFVRFSGRNRPEGRHAALLGQEFHPAVRDARAVIQMDQPSAAHHRHHIAGRARIELEYLLFIQYRDRHIHCLLF